MNKKNISFFKLNIFVFLLLLYLAARSKRLEGDWEQSLTLLLSAVTLMEKQISIPLELAGLYSHFGLKSESAETLDRYAAYLPPDHPLLRTIKELSNSISYEVENRK